MVFGFVTSHTKVQTKVATLTAEVEVNERVILFQEVQYVNGEFNVLSVCVESCIAEWLQSGMHLFE